MIGFCRSASEEAVLCAMRGVSMRLRVRQKTMFVFSTAHRLSPDAGLRSETCCTCAQVLMGHLLNLNDNHDALRFRLLPHDQYTNLRTYEQWAMAGQHTREVIIHPCCTADKVGDMTKVRDQPVVGECISLQAASHAGQPTCCISHEMELLLISLERSEIHEPKLCITACAQSYNFVA